MLFYEIGVQMIQHSAVGDRGADRARGTAVEIIELERGESVQHDTVRVRGVAHPHW